MPLLSGLVRGTLPINYEEKNTLQEKESENLSTLKSAFVRDIPLVCSYQGSAIEITQTDFNLSNGTMSFQGKPNSSYSHIIIPLQDCTLQEVD